MRPKAGANSTRPGSVIRRKSPRAYRSQINPPLWCRSSLEKATQGDEPGLDQTLEAQAQSGLERPSELYADGAYVSAPRLHKAAEEGWTLMGPAPASPQRPGPVRLPVKDFSIDIINRRARCPAGHESRRCSRI